MKRKAVMRVNQLLLYLLIIGTILFSACTTPLTTPSPTQQSESTKITSSGRITKNETWSGTVHLTGDLAIESNITITILPGTVVLFSAGSDDRHTGVEVIEYYEERLDPASTLDYSQSHISIDVHPRGKIIARGTPDNPILFTSDSPNPNYADWEQIYLQSGSVFEYCIVEFGRGGVIAEGDVIVSHNTFRKIFWVAIVTRGSPTVTQNEISSCGHGGVEAWGESAAPVISNNIIKYCRAGIGIGFKDEVFPTIENNTLIDNDIGIWLGSGSGGTIYGNSISAPNGAPSDWGPFQGFVYKARVPRDRYEEVLGLGLTSSSPTISHNQLFQLAQGIGIEGDSSPVIEYNTITDCYNGFVFHHYSSGLPKIHKNNIYNNKDRNIRQDEGGTGSIDAANNWWGTTDIKEVEAKIHDFHDDPSLGEVNFQPISTSEIVQLHSKAEFKANQSADYI
jgi:parallel beta-helix repeat protein